ncbi:MAG: GTP-binding protein [Elusimicrobia bacterium HGW-Elusimicrobia-2]|nr:MAG: GTP-binding protein [Elusimicrobia bacterium HGW-Elusimicrobia-2]
MAKQIYIDREIGKVLRKQIKSFSALALTGPRQSGKSTLVRKLFEKSHKIISFDDPLIRERAIADPKLFLEAAGSKAVFDEIQYVPEILSYIKMLIDGDRRKKGRFIFTGSQQFNLIKNLGDTLAGRIALFDLLPFGIEEKRKIPALKRKLLNVKNAFIHSCLRGSFPEINIDSKIDSSVWYGSYIQTYLERDVRTIYNVGILREFQRFLHLLASRCSQILNISGLSGDLGVSANTVKKWLSVLEASRIIYVLPPFWRNYGKRITKSPKIYFLDSGLVCYLTGIKTEEHLLTGPMAGAMFENFVVQETVKCFMNSGRKPDLFYLRTQNNLEIDLILEKNLEVYPLEIKLSKTPNLGMAASIERYKKVFQGLKVKEGKIICLTEEDFFIKKDISAVNVDSYLKWLKRFISRK